MSFTGVVPANSTLGLALLMALAACSPTPTPGTTADTTTGDPTTREWDDQGIDDYTLAYSITNMNGMGGGDYDGVYTFEVRDGQVTKCVVTELGEHAALAEGVCNNLTSPIEFLFSWVDRFDPRYTSVEYDSESHLPATVTYDDPQTADEEHAIRLLRFDNLETSP